MAELRYRLWSGVMREMKHRMIRKITCKYFPDFFDGEECLYVHESKSLPEGKDCENQSCTFCVLWDFV